MAQAPSTTFDVKTTAEEVAQTFSDHIKGRTILITGASPRGLGHETARVLAKHEPSLLILAGRSQSKLQETTDLIKQESPNVDIRILILDLSSQEKVRKAADEVLAYPEPSIDILINNAAVMVCPYDTTEDGIELQFGTNHIGPFLFTDLILPKVLASTNKPGPRIVNVGSSGHIFGGIRFDDVGFQQGTVYERWEAYGQSKTANILFTVELAARYKAKGVTVMTLHPGGINTELQRHVTEEDREQWRKSYPHAFLPDGTVDPKSGFWKTLACGAATQVRAALDPTLVEHSGSYMNDCVVANETARDYTLNPEFASKLWTLSEELVKQTFPAPE